MPNRKISIRAGVVAGIATGVMYQIVQWAYLTLQLGASSYNAIYGSFAALPLFLVWLQLGWFVVLFGCQISYFVQNYEIFRHNEKFSNLSFSLKKNIVLQICQNIVMRFVNAEKASTAEQIANELQIPLSVVQSSLFTLLECDIIVELNVLEDNEMVYQPAQDINNLTIDSVTSALEIYGLNSIPEMKGYEQFSKLDTSVQNTLIKDI